MTAAKEKCAGILAGIAQLIQSCDRPEAKAKLIQIQALFQEEMADATEAESELIVHMFHNYLDEGDR